jgi:hypothetical protein
MEKFRVAEVLERSIPLFKRAAAKGHEESIWILRVVKDMKMEWEDMKEDFAKTGEPLGWYFAGMLSEDDRERFDFYKKSAEAGCSWGQAKYGQYFELGRYVGLDQKSYLEWLEKAANQNNPGAMNWLGDWFRNDGDEEKAVMYFRGAAELGWKDSMRYLATMLRDGKGCERDLRQAVIWNAKEGSYFLWDPPKDAKEALESGTTEGLEFDFDQLCYTVGWGLYWYRYGTGNYNRRSNEQNAFDSRCLQYYCSCVEQQQKSIFTFLLFWNRTTRVKEPGQMIAQMVWEGREENLVKQFEVSGDEEERETK